MDVGSQELALPFLAKTERLLRRLAPAAFRARQIAAQSINAGFELALDFSEDFVE
jgi:hypothetical protein